MITSTKVIFRAWPKREGGSAIALFPREAATVGNPGHCLSYEQVGQHGGADLFALTHSLRLAARAEYRELAAELRRIGYRLKISCRATRADYLARKLQLA